MINKMAIVAFGLILAGCSATRNSSSAVTANKLVTAADAQRILGGAVRLGSEWRGPSDSLPGALESRCEYVGADRATLNVVFENVSSEDLARKAYVETGTALASFSRVEDVGGIGEEAFLSQSGGSRKLTVRKKTVLFQMDARVNNDDGPSIEEMKQTAARVVNQLQESNAISN